METGSNSLKLLGEEMRVSNVMKSPLSPGRLTVLMTSLCTPYLVCITFLVHWAKNSPRSPGEFSG